MCSALHGVASEGSVVKLSELKVGDEIFYRGESYLAFKDGRKTGTSGEAATLATVALGRTSEAGVSEDGVLEFGYSGGGSMDHVPDEDVLLMRSGVSFHSSVYRSVKREDCSLACEKTLYTAADAARAELRRQTLRRGMRAEEMNAGELTFRKAVKNSLDKGIGVAEIVEQTGLSRARVYQIRDGRR